MLSRVETCTSEHQNRYPRTFQCSSQGFHRHHCRSSRIDWFGQRTKRQRVGEWSRRRSHQPGLGRYLTVHQFLSMCRICAQHSMRTDWYWSLVEGFVKKKNRKERICKCLIDFLCHVLFSRPYCALRWHGAEGGALLTYKRLLPIILPWFNGGEERGRVDCERFDGTIESLTALLNSSVLLSSQTSIKYRWET